MNPPPPLIWRSGLGIILWIFFFVSATTLWVTCGGRYSGFQVGIIEWGQKPKPKKIPRASNKTRKKSLDQTLTPKNLYNEFPSLKHFQKALKNKEINVCICLFITPFEVICYECSVCLEYRSPKKSLKTIKPQKKILAKISYPKSPRIKNFKPKTILRSSLSLQIWSTPSGIVKSVLNY